jgi:hypothetical protein
MGSLVRTLSELRVVGRHGSAIGVIIFLNAICVATSGLLDYFLKEKFKSFVNQFLANSTGGLPIKHNGSGLSKTMHCYHKSVMIESIRSENCEILPSAISTDGIPSQLI